VKGIGGLVAAGAAALVAFLLLRSVGGGARITGPTRKITPPKVDANDAATQATRGANKGADWISTLTPNTWKVVAICVLALVCVVMWKASPKFRGVVIGIALVLAVIAAVKL